MEGAQIPTSLNFSFVSTQHSGYHEGLTDILPLIASFFSKISPEHTFDFIDAQFEGSAAPGIADVFPGPYFSWYQKYNPENVEKVHEYLQSVIDEDGPYDGIIGFSEGAALAASFLLSREYRTTFDPVSENLMSDFKMAVFFNSVKPYSPSEEIGSDAAEQFQQELRRHSLFLKGQTAERRKSSISDAEISALAERRQSVRAQRRESIIAWKNDSMLGEKVGEAEVDNKVQSHVWDSLFSPVFSFDPDSFPCKIRIPTLNVIGTNDQFCEYSEELTKLCDPEQMEIARVAIGHEIARSGDGLEKVVELFEMVVMMASIGGS
jgi:hypothetical protein